MLPVSRALALIAVALWGHGDMASHPEMDHDPLVSTVTKFGSNSSLDGLCVKSFVATHSAQVSAATAAVNVVGVV